MDSFAFINTSISPSLNTSNVWDTDASTVSTNFWTSSYLKPSITTGEVGIATDLGDTPSHTSTLTIACVLGAAIVSVVLLVLLVEVGGRRKMLRWFSGRKTCLNRDVEWDERLVEVEHGGHM